MQAESTRGKRKPPKPKPDGAKKKRPTAAETRSKRAGMVGGAVLFRLRIDGHPKAWSRVRVNHATGAFFNASDLSKWEKQSALLMRSAANAHGAFGQVHGPVTVLVLAIYPRPAGADAANSEHPAHRTPRFGSRDDLDNCLKAVCDALQKSGVIANDGQVACIYSASAYAAKGEKPGVCVQAVTLDPNEEPPDFGFPVVKVVDGQEVCDGWA